MCTQQTTQSIIASMYLVAQNLCALATDHALTLINASVTQDGWVNLVILLTASDTLPHIQALVLEMVPVLRQIDVLVRSDTVGTHVKPK